MWRGRKILTELMECGGVEEVIPIEQDEIVILCPLLEDVEHTVMSFAGPAIGFGHHHFDVRPSHDSPNILFMSRIPRVHYDKDIIVPLVLLLSCHGIVAKSRQIGFGT